MLSSGRFLALIASCVVLIAGTVTQADAAGHTTRNTTETTVKVSSKAKSSAVKVTKAAVPVKAAARKTVVKRESSRTAQAQGKTKTTQAKANASRRVKVSLRQRVEPVRKAVVRVEPDFDRDGNPLIRSAAFLVQDIDSGRVLLEKNAQTQQPIASISKLMTAMVVLDAHLDLNEALEVTDDDVDHLKNTTSHLPIGTVLTRDEMLHLALMASENRAASALGRNYPGGRAAFIEAMNVKARMMGLRETYFADSIGLNKNNVSSARDLAIIVANAARYPLIRDFTTSAEYSVDLNGRPRTFRNTNALVREAGSDWQIGLSKTGYISESGRCLVMQAWFGEKPVAIVLLDAAGSYTRLGDANRIRKWVENSIANQSHLATVQQTSHIAN